MKKRIKKLYILLTILLIIFLYARYVEPNRLIIKSQDLYLPNFNPNLNGIKLAIVSDLHIGTKHVPIEKVKKIGELISNQTPDAVLILGDFDAMSVTYSGKSSSEISNSLSYFKNAYAVLGNHDYEPTGVIEQILRSSGINLLKNQSVYIDYNNSKLRICGINDIWHEKVYVKSVIGDISNTTILLSHNPDIFPKVPDKISLTLSGHTHGGEVSFPILGPPFVPSVYGQKYSKGHVVENNKHLFVTSGVASLSRLRLFNPPEIVILNLYSDNGYSDDKLSTKLLQSLIQGYNKQKFAELLHCH